MLINNHTDANKGKIKGYLYVEYIFGFCKAFKKVTKNLVFHLMLKTADLQDIIYTSMDDDINVTINILYLYLPNLIPSVETQLMFNEATQNIYRISYEECYTERRLITDMIAQVDLGSAHQVNSPKYMICAHQTKDRLNTSVKKINIAVFDNLDLRKFYDEIDGQRYPRDSISKNNTENDYKDQYRELKLFFCEKSGEAILNPLITYPDMKPNYSVGIIDLKYQPDQLTSKRIQLFHKYGTDRDKARLFLMLIRRTEIEIISDGNKLIEVKVI